MAAREMIGVDAARFWSTVVRSGEIGPGKAGGLRRPALSDADKEMRDLFGTWCTEAGCTADILSQAGHDAYYVSRIAPTAMIFTPCRDGTSHNEAEHAELDSTSPGVDLLLHAVLVRANR